MSKIFKIFKKIFGALYNFIDKIIIIPISRIIYRLSEVWKNNSGNIEKLLNRPNVLIYVSLLCSIILFILIDSKALNLVNNEAEILSNQPVRVIYNQEAYVVEGVPETVDITLIGRKSNLYLAKQLGEHEAILDLSGYSVGTYKVRLKYNHSIDSVSYKLDPSTIPIKISEKVSVIKSLDYDLLNENKLDSKLSIKSVELDRSEITVRGSAETLDKISKVKALIDLSTAGLTEKGTFTIDSNILVAYDHNGNKITNVEFVTTKISASVEVSSNYKEVAIKVVTTGKLTTGFAIKSAESSVKKVSVYGDESILSDITFIEAKVDLDGLNSDKTLNVTLTKPSGIRHMSETSTTVDIKLGDETSIEIPDVQVIFAHLGNNYSVSAVSNEDRVVSVIAKGVSSVLSEIQKSSIVAEIDLSGYTTGTHDVEIKVKIDDVRVSLVPKNTTVKVKIGLLKN